MDELPRQGPRRPQPPAVEYSQVTPLDEALLPQMATSVPDSSGDLVASSTADGSGDDEDDDDYGVGHEAGEGFLYGAADGVSLKQESLADPSLDYTQDEPHGTAPIVGNVDGIARTARPVYVLPKARDVGPQFCDLTEEQHSAVDLALTGRSMCITGGGGCGKSFVVKLIARSRDRVAVVAPTGLAALQIGGRTIHSFFGLSTFDDIEGATRAVNNAARNDQTRERVKEVQTLIIDEISMVSQLMFDTLDRLTRNIRQMPNTPFGGLQVIVCGDFLQLPPVGRQGAAPLFCFDSAAWQALDPYVAVLRQVHRQTDDRFVTVLNNIREGKLSDADRRYLMQSYALGEKHDYTVLRGSNHAVNEKNRSAMLKIGRESFFYRAVTTGPGSESGTAYPVPDVLELKVGARVMLRKNLDVSLVNGSCGVVTSLNSLSCPGVENDLPKEDVINFKQLGATHYPVISFDGLDLPRIIVPAEFRDGNDKNSSSRLQLPLSLAFALTIHKSQGMSLDYVDCEFRADKDQFADGLMYVALSRAKTCGGLRALLGQGIKPRVNFRALQWTTVASMRQAEEDQKRQSRQDNPPGCDPLYCELAAKKFLVAPRVRANP